MYRHVQVSGQVIKQCLDQPEHFHYTEDEQCLFTFAKAYYKGGGWWLLSGYSPDGSDVQRVLDRISTLEN